MINKIIIIPGLGDRVKNTELATRKWKSYGLEPIIYSANWYSKEGFSEKLAKLLKFIDSLVSNGDKVSIIGCSAGASLALNAFIKRKEVLSKAVSVCGRLRDGNIEGFRSLKRRARKSGSFAESVKAFEKREGLLSPTDRNGIMTMRAICDELVPASTSTLVGVKNIVIPVPEHSLGIYSALSIFSNPLIRFLKY